MLPGKTPFLSDHCSQHWDAEHIPKPLSRGWRQILPQSWHVLGLQLFPTHRCVIAALKASALDRYFGFKSHRFNFSTSSSSNLVPSVVYCGLCRPLEPEIRD